MLYTGSNWIPAHNFLTTLGSDDYRAWLTLLRDGNQSMVRLWGGGVYEPDVFYDICDGNLAKTSEALYSSKLRIGNTGMARLHVRMWTGLQMHIKYTPSHLSFSIPPTTSFLND